MQPTEQQRIEALVSFLDIDSEYVFVSQYGEHILGIGQKKYLVLTDSEADKAAREYIEDSLWMFYPQFLVAYMPDGITADVIAKMQESLYEDATAPIRALVGDRFDNLVIDAIASDGRGHFLAGDDGDEHKSGEFFIYRVD